MQDIFKFDQEYIDDTGKIHGSLKATGLRPKYYDHILENGVKLPIDVFRPQESNGAAGRRATLIR
jgi:pilus assembly protein CpaF